MKIIWFVTGRGNQKSDNGLNLYTPVCLKDIKLLIEAQTEDGQTIQFELDQLQAHPGCVDPVTCAQVNTKPDCKNCKGYSVTENIKPRQILELLRGQYMAYKNMIRKYIDAK